MLRKSTSENFKIANDKLNPKCIQKNEISKFYKNKKSLIKKTGIRIIFIYFIYSIQRIKSSKKCSKILCDLRNKLKNIILITYSQNIKKNKKSAPKYILIWYYQNTKQSFIFIRNYETILWDKNFNHLSFFLLDENFDKR